MGILYNSVKLKNNMKQKMVLERLIELGITESNEGKSIHDMSYDELKILWVLSEMRQVDIEHPGHKWFR